MSDIEPESKDKLSTAQSIGCMLIGIAVLGGAPLLVGFLYFLFPMLAAS